MTRIGRRSKLPRRVVFCALVGLSPLLLSACSVGNNAPMEQFHHAGEGAYATVSGMEVINAFVLGPASGGTVPAGGSASVFLSLFNGSGGTDRLVSVTAPGTAKSVQITGGSIAVPAQQAVYLTGPKPRVVLRHLTHPLRNGGSITLDFSFRNAGSVTTNPPVLTRTSYYSTYSPPPPTGSPSGGAKTSGPSTRAGAGTATGSPAATGTGSPPSGSP